jgi:hypothetical protein
MDWFWPFLTGLLAGFVLTITTLLVIVNDVNRKADHTLSFPKIEEDEADEHATIIKTD